MHHPTDRIAHTTVFVTPVVEHWLEREMGIEQVKQIEEKEKVRGDLKNKLIKTDYLVPYE